MCSARVFLMSTWKVLQRGRNSAEATRQRHNRSQVTRHRTRLCSQPTPVGHRLNAVPFRKNQPCRPLNSGPGKSDSSRSRVELGSLQTALVPLPAELSPLQSDSGALPIELSPLQTHPSVLPKQASPLRTESRPPNPRPEGQDPHSTPLPQGEGCRSQIAARNGACHTVTQHAGARAEVGDVPSLGCAGSWRESIKDRRTHSPQCCRASQSARLV